MLAEFLFIFRERNNGWETSLRVWWLGLWTDGVANLLEKILI